MPEDKGLTRSQREEKVLQFWKEKRIFQKSLTKPHSKGNFVFYEGPPTANGKPGIHHLESRAFKDAIPRYKTMRGYHVPRQAGWDTHGLPVELEVEKELGLKSKREIEEYGINKFNERCRESVGKYIDIWEKFTERIGYWVNLSEAYFTYDNSYIERVWGIISHVHKQDLLYKDYKVLPWCPRCGTALSSHELAQGYKDVKDLSLYVKFPLRDFPKAYFLAWTTTPWTLPGNLALAVGPDITYVEAKVRDEIYVLAKDRLKVLPDKYEIIAEHKGSEMVGMDYEPLYSFMAVKSEKTFKIYPADFVTTEDGTGIVHTAVMYGQEDFDLGTKVGLPKEHLVNADGKFKNGTDFLEGKSVVDESTAVEILKDLQSRGLLFAKESHQHSYPFCWRCGTRLIYYARDSWYIAMSKLREELTKENEKINWEPEHIKEGRFGEWLKEVKDWAISRERYWGTPLPVWQSEDGEKLIVSSLKELREFSKRSGNRYFIMRHGEARHNVEHFLDPKGNPENHLTERGKQEAKAAAQGLKGEKIDYIFTSPFLRTKETAEIVRGELGLASEKIIIDERLREFDEETLDDVRVRTAGFFFEKESEYSGKNVLIISHGNPLWEIQEFSDWRFENTFDAEVMVPTGTYEEINFVPYPHDESFYLDLHRPYIDEVILEKDGKTYTRAKEVMDVWLDSGSMPFSSQATGYPADYISEAIDQTRGWFYTLHAVGVLMGKGRAFSNVICLGHILDKDGKKMSKSVGNVVEPFHAFEKHGVDVLRYWMYTVNQPGDSKNFDERTVEEVNRRVFNLLDNVWAFYDLYRDKTLESSTEPKSDHVLDKWILKRLNILTREMTECIEGYKLLEPTRALREFIDELSTWYLRRSRERIKEGDKSAKVTLYHVLRQISKLLAPFAPFVSEELYQKLRVESDPESVHLEAWPETHKNLLDFGKSEKLIEDMRLTRKIVSEVLMVRNRENIKIRQPLLLLKIQNDQLNGKQEYIELIKDEVNVKEVQFDKNMSAGFYLETTITPELAEEGEIREEVRNLQELRKERGLSPRDTMEYTPPNDKAGFYKKHAAILSKATNIRIVND